jgi:alanyl-tRNA synthetase
MGLERLAMALQGKQSNYDTDLFQTLIQHMVKVSGINYGKSEETDIALRVIADHIRAIAFSIADGQIPSNNGAGYVIRRILRRAVRYGYQTLGLKEPFLCDLSVVLTQLMGDAFPELKAQSELVQKVIREEELSFFRTLEQGIKRIENCIQQTKAKNIAIISGSEVFELYDTYGFPVDLTSLIARENGLSIDEKGFEEELQKQKDRSRAATAIETDDWVEVNNDEATNFIGYDQTEADVHISRYRKVTQKNKTFYQIVLNQTPFYPEGGGQLGDKGTLISANDKISIFDTKKENNLIIHLSDQLPSNPKDKFTAKINIENRLASAANHSATHLLHHALRTVLGTHVEQKGSLVCADYLRFDFSHFSKVTDEEMAKIEQMIIDEIHQNIALNEQRAVSMDVAKAAGAMALFGEKYGDKVRVIQFGDSVELCGGTHVQNTSQIGLFKITSEGAVAAGIRRIEAITGKGAEIYFREKATKLDSIALQLKNPKDIVKAVEDLQTKSLALQKEIETLQREKALGIKKELKHEIIALNGVHFLEKILPLDNGSIKDILFQLKGETENFVGVIGGNEGDKCSINVIISENLVAEKGLNAGAFIKEVAPFIKGGGGGQAFYATAGGKDASGLQQAIDLIKGKI